MYALRIALIFLIVYLLVRAFIMVGESKEPPKRVKNQDNDKMKRSKGVPKGIGEYVDYEEIDKRAGSTSKT
jgi:hypothetical protein